MRNPILTAILGLFLLFGFVPFGQADEAAEITKMTKEKVNNVISYLHFRLVYNPFPCSTDRLRLTGGIEINRRWFMIYGICTS